MVTLPQALLQTEEVLAGIIVLELLQRENKVPAQMFSCLRGFAVPEYQLSLSLLSLSSGRD